MNTSKKFLKTGENYLIDFFYLFYPNLCNSCEKNGLTKGELFCLECRLRLPKADHHLHKENKFTERFWGRVVLEAAASIYLFKKESRTQNIIHNLKYKGKRQIGRRIGNEYGLTLNKSGYFDSVDIIVPVPLHWKKYRKRGYNQSYEFGKGLSETMNVPIIKDGIRRLLHSDSQTRKNKVDRLKNVSQVFEVKRQKELIGRHILLVDDVLTTGATLEACANKLLELPGTKVSMVTIAMAVE